MARMVPAIERATLAAVTWERLRLEGFGRFARLEARFGGGLETWVGPNETGKSTAVMGLLATLYGLPHVQDPHGRTWARYRAWSGGPHRGTLTLRALDGERYTVTREFDRHAVKVVRHGDRGDEVVVEGTHNPNARREASAYEPWLERSVGLTDLGVVLATFVVPQGDGPASPHRLTAEVQALVAGAGGEGYHVALERLADALRERTRSLRPLDLGLADGRNDRELERLEATLEADRRALEEGRAAADGTQAAQLRLARADEAYAAARTACERAKRTLEAQRAWVDRREAARREAARAAEVRRALARARALQRDVADAARDLEATWPAFAGAPEGTLTALERLAASRARSAEARSAVAEAQAALQERRAEAAAALERLDEGPLVPEDGRDWSLIGTPAASALLRLRRSATALVRQAETVRGAQARLAEIEEELTPIDVFDGLDDETRTLLEAYVPRGRAMFERLTRARSRHDELAERMRRHAAAFADVRALSDEEVEALEALERAWERRRDPWAWRIAAGVSGAVAGALLMPWGLEVLGQGGHGWAPWLGAATLATVGVLLVPSRDDTRAARERLAELGLEGDHEELRQRLRQREAFEAQRAQVEDDALAFERAQQETIRAEQEALAFRDAVAPFAAALPPGVEVDQAYARWKLLAPRAEREREALAAQVRYLAEVEPDEVADATAAQAGEAAAELARFAAFQGVFDAELDDAADRIGVLELADWYERVSDATWEVWAAAAAEHDAHHEEHLETGRDRRRKAEVWAERIAQAERSLAAARARFAAADRDDAEATSALAWLWPRLATAGGAGDVGDEADARDDALIADDEVFDLGLPEGGGAVPPWDVRALRRGWDERRRAEEAAEDARRTLSAQLAAAGVADVAELQRASEHADVAASAALARWQELVERHPDLPRADLEDEEPVEARFRGIEEAAAAAEDRERLAHDEVLEAQRTLARMQGLEVVNVAALELQIAATEAEVGRVRDEVEALALAYRELTVAVDDFRSAHRQRLEEDASSYFARFSRREGRKVVLDDDFNALVRESDGSTAVPAQVSQGARDQLALALRLAVADLLSGDVAVPLMFDDPFLNWDDDRSEVLREALATVAAERQVLVLSHRRSVAAWGRQVEREVQPG